MRPRGVGLTPAYILSRYHQSFRIQFYLQWNNRSHRRSQTDSAFSTDSKLDLLRVVGSVCWAESLYNLQSALKRWSNGGAPTGFPMPKSAYVLLKGKNSTIDGIMIAYLFMVEWVDTYKEKLWLLSLLDSDTVSLPFGEEFPFPYHRPVVKG